MRSGIASVTWETSYVTLPTSCQSTGIALASSGTVSTGTTSSLSGTASTQTPSVNSDLGRLWVFHRTIFTPEDPNYTKQCFYDMFESRMSEAVLFPCSQPYNATWHIGRGSDCDGGYLMPIPEFNIGFDILGVNTGCWYHPEALQIFCDQGHYPCRFENHIDYIHCSNETEAPMTNYNGYVRMACDGFLAK